ncbi:MAG TPA: SprT family zinc-dependent metalloprotease [Hydrogenophaga sp.]|uniref:M48 family metallopeptidase n=1 Tax=Hydrogenophaga sp. TaxID=1904254 RepID=UPI002B73CFD7|nr:SprT family zinc-dependent metalloprotease [Hydrogenophaga sp.]HMN93428.1 SprT family zinc-dependent metalloprotease [Hydrogenophaga sp.]HMP11440.1 SprT family zinc-dependent metalloprotease [Hydrogenophaga sp.]
MSAPAPMQRFVQLALDFLSGADAPAAEPPPRRVQDPSPGVPAEPMEVVFQPGVWRHPRANRRVQLAGCEVAYEFKRGKRRTIGLSVSQEGLSVRAPRWTTVGEVDSLLFSKSDWVLDKLQRARERSQQLAQARTVWADGAPFDWLGRRVLLRLDPTHDFRQAGAVLERADMSADDSEQALILRLGLSVLASEAQIRDAAQAWLMREARRVFEERLAHFAPLLGVQWRVLRLSSAGTRWGSASADGTIRLNWRLVHLSLDMIDYVVVHELSHLRHMDHSPQFWDVVASVMPDHAARRRALRESPLAAGG